jgi:hypothetical protein
MDAQQSPEPGQILPSGRRAAPSASGVALIIQPTRISWCVFSIAMRGAVARTLIVPRHRLKTS